MGFEAKTQPDLHEKYIDFAGTEKRRTSEVLAALRDPETKAIWAARGGYGASYVLDGLLTDEVRRANKWLIGFSDLSALHAAWARAGVASLHASTVHYLERWSPSGRDELLQHLQHKATESVHGTTSYGTRTVEGWLTGGNLTVLTSLAGTGYLPSWEGAIVFLEDVGEAPYRLERQLLQLYQAGAFNGVVGIALGQFTACGTANSEVPDRVVQFLRAKVPVPILTGLPVGHDADSRPLLFGLPALLDPHAQTLTSTAF